MQLDDTLLMVFTATIDDGDDTPVIQLPEQELKLGTLSAGETYQVAILARPGSTADSKDRDGGQRQRQKTPTPSTTPPVSVGDELEVEIEDVGEEGDGIARVGPGYVIFVPDAELGNRATIKITKVRENFSFAEVITVDPISE